jgi:hypothetical protein
MADRDEHEVRVGDLAGNSATGSVVTNAQRF